MKTKHLLGLGVVIAVTGFAASAQAGSSFAISVGIPFGANVRYAPRYSAPVVYCPPPVTCYRAPVVYVAPRCGPYYGYSDYRDYRGHDRHHHRSEYNARGYDRGGHR